MRETHQAILTIVVPTYNRYSLLLRLLRYYQVCGAPFPMRILDSSYDDEPAEIRSLIQSLNVTHVRYDPQTLPTAKLCDGVQAVTTPYVVLWADDDLMVPRAFARGLQFLETHSDFSIAHGQSGLFQVTTAGSQSVISDVSSSRQRSYLEATAAQRLQTYLMDNTLVFYSIQRTAHAQHHFGQCRQIGLGYTDPTDELHHIHRSDAWVELLLGCLSIIQGKAQQLPGLYMLRDSHPGANSWEAPGKTLDYFDWITSPSFSSTSEAFRACLSQAVADQDHISLPDARAAVKRAMWIGLATNLTKKWQASYGQREGLAQSRWRERARRIPGLHMVWRAARSRIPGRELTLEALQRPSSPYHDDFLPIYQAIIAPLTDGHRNGDAVSWTSPASVSVGI